ncbi:hypothetical protein IP023_01255 [Sphingobacterium rhinopitheci]|nr:hypothetical protein [Sphingobacterium rhinopitheci]
MEMWDLDIASNYELYNQISKGQFHEEFAMYVELRVSVIQPILYFNHKEIHHRGQEDACLRSLATELSFFWDRF